MQFFTAAGAALTNTSILVTAASYGQKYNVTDFVLTANTTCVFSFYDAATTTAEKTRFSLGSGGGMVTEHFITPLVFAGDIRVSTSSTVTTINISGFEE